MPTRSLAVMFTDIKGFTARTSEQTREDLVSLLAAHERLLVPVFRHFKATIVKTIGDAFLVYFESPTEAVLCGVAVQEVLHMYNASAEAARRLDVRVAINAGDVELIDGDVLGEPVNIAARLEGIAEAGEVYFTEAVYLTMNRREAPSTEVGERTFKGIPHPIRVYKVIRESAPEPIRQLAQKLHAEAKAPGVPAKEPKRVEVIEFPAKPAPARKGRRVLQMLGGAVLGALAMTVVLMLRNPALGQARELVARGERLNALTVLDARLKERPGDLDAQQLARETAQAHLDVLLKKEDQAEALAWLREQLARKPYLEGMKPQLPPLEARVVMTELVSGKKYARQDKIYDTARELMAKYPDDPEVPFIVADIMGKRYIKESVLWLYEEGIQRGHKVEPRVWEACVDAFEDNLPASEYARTAHELAKAHFDAQRTEWAHKALNEGSIHALLNALTILDEKNDGAAQDPFVRNMRDLAMGERMESVVTALLAEKDLQRGRRATALAQEVVKMGEPDLPEQIRTLQKATAEKLTATWGEQAMAPSP